MHSTESNITYDTIDSWLFNKIPWFKEYFLIIWDEDDREEKYNVIWELADLFSKKVNSDPEICEQIMNLLYTLWIKSDYEINDLISSWFIEGLKTDKNIDVLWIRDALKYKEFQDIYDMPY